MTSRSFMKSLFSGRLEADLIFPYPRPGSEVNETLDLVLEAFPSRGAPGS